MPVLTEAVRLLSDPRLGKGDPEFLQKTGWKLLPFLVITSSEVGIAHSIARSSIFNQHPLTLSWAQGEQPDNFLFESFKILGLLATNVLFASQQSSTM